MELFGITYVHVVHVGIESLCIVHLVKRVSRGWRRVQYV